MVVAHHHFAPAPDYLHDMTMPKAKRAMMRFVDLKVDMILEGHLHRAFIGNSLGFYPGIHPERGSIIAQPGTTTLVCGRGREQEKNTFNVIEIYGNAIEVTLLGRQSAQFHATQFQTFLAIGTVNGG